MVSRTECNAAGAHQNAVNASLLLNLINNNFLIFFLTENLPILNPCLPQRSENLRPHPSNSIEMRPHHNHHSRENATASSGTSPLASCKGTPPLGKRRIENSGAVWGISVCPHSWRRETGSRGRGLYLRHALLCQEKRGREEWSRDDAKRTRCLIRTWHCDVTCAKFGLSSGRSRLLLRPEKRSAFWKQYTPE